MKDSKIVKKFKIAARKLVIKTLNGESFQFDAPKSFSRVFCTDDEDVDLEAVRKYADKLRKELKKTKKYNAKKYSLSDNGDVVLDVFPMPIPNVHVYRKNEILRYSGTLFLRRNWILLSLVRVPYASETKGVAGIDLTKKEAKMISQVKEIVGQEMLAKTIAVEAIADIEMNAYRNTSFSTVPTEAVLAKAIEELPAPILTIPLLIGEAAPASNVIFLMDWKSFERPSSDSFRALQNGFGNLMRNMAGLVDAFEEEFSRFSLDGQKYSDAYFFVNCNNI